MFMKLRYILSLKQKIYSVKVSKKYLNEGENILVLDDFLANGRAALGLKDLVDQANANLVGVGIVIEKGFQDGETNFRKSRS